MAAPTSNAASKGAPAAAPGASPPSGAPTPAPKASAGWREAWPVPVLGLGLVGVVAAAVVAIKRAPEPDRDVLFRTAERLASEEKYAEAIESLNKDVLPVYAKGQLNPDQARKFHLMLARSIALGQRALGISREDNTKNVVDRYREAERRNATLEASDQRLLAEALIELGELDEAKVRADDLGESDPGARIELYRAMADRALRGPTPNDAMALHLIGTLLADPELPAEARGWATTRQVEILLGQGYAEEAITRALRALPRLEQNGDGSWGELLGLLGRAYLKTGAAEEAEKQLLRARELLGENDPAVAGVILALGKIEFNRDKAASGELFEQVTSRFPESPESLAALLALAEVHAWLGNSEGELGAPPAPIEHAAAETADPMAALAPGEAGEQHPVAQTPIPAAKRLERGRDGEGEIRTHRDEAMARYTQLVERLAKGDVVDREVTPEIVGASLLSNYKDRFDAQDFETALRYASVAEQLFGTERSPAAVMLALAEVHRRLGERVLGERVRDLGEGAALSLAKADPATQALAKRHFIESGRYSRAHADRVVLSDNVAFGNSVWAAAEMYDRAGDLEEALRAFQDFVQGFPSDPRLPEAKFHLAQTHQARGEVASAIAIYRDLISDRTASRTAGPFADASYVPLARAILSDGDASNDAEAEEKLNAVLSGAVGGPSTPMYRGALEEFADLCYGAKRFEEAVAKLEELIARYGRSTGEGAGEEGVGTEMYFKLADSRRLAARAIEAGLARGGMPDSDRKRLEDERGQHLRSAIEEFEGVRRKILAKGKRTKLDEMQLRNAYFHLGDCAFELEDYESSIRYDDAARERYPNDPASLVAMTQIVSAHLRRGEVAKAITANERARRFFTSLPDSVWDDPSLPMGRVEWERWLDSTAELAKSMREGETHQSAGVGEGAG